MTLLTATRLALIVAMIVFAAISAWVMVASINEEDADLAWGWAAVFVGTSLMAAWFFWSLVEGGAA